MRMLVFSTQSYDRVALDRANAGFGHALEYLETRLDRHTATLARGAPAVCVFVNDVLDAETLALLYEGGTRLIALRCAGYNQVDLRAADALELTVVRVPAYSPHAVAEHAVALILCLDRKLHRAYNRVRENNFRLDGLEGFDLFGKTIGVIGTGRIGSVFARIMLGFGCRVLACDAAGVDAALLQAGVEARALSPLLADSDIVSLHCPLTPDTYHLIDESALSAMRPGAMLINTSRGGLLDTAAVVRALKQGQLGALGLDVYEQEGDLFFEDLSDRIVPDDVFQRLLTFPNVLITGHQAFLTREALTAIAVTTLQNVRDFEAGVACANRITSALLQPAAS
jgi:D-lactate dehydrogenase